MKIRQLLVVTSIFAVFALAGCEAQKPLTEATAEPVVATQSAPVVAEPAFVVPSAPLVKAHCDRHHFKAKAAHNCAKHCKKHKKVKKGKACKVHCEKEAK